MRALLLKQYEKQQSIHLLQMVCKSQFFKRYAYGWNYLKSDQQVEEETGLQFVDPTGMDVYTNIELQ